MATTLGAAAVILWGMLALLGSLTTRVPPFQLLFFCFSVSAALMLLRRWAVGVPLFSPPRLTGKQWALGVLGLFGFHLCYFLALRAAPAIEVSLIVYLWPLLLSLLVALPGRRLNALLGGSLGFIGIATVVTGGAQLAPSGAALGYALALLCAAIWAGYSWYLSASQGNVDDIGWLSLAVAALSLGAHLALETGVWRLTAGEWAGIVLLGLGPVGGAFYLWDIGLKHGNRPLLASLSFAAPLISAVVLAAAGLNRWSPDIVIALMLITLGGVIANRKPERYGRRSRAFFNSAAKR